MKFGAREICDVVLKATVEGQKVGSYKYAKGQPVMYFDSLKTSSIEQASTPVYAQGGKGNSRLISWDGDKTVTYTMEDALLSPISLAILAKANIAKPTSGAPMIVHVQERISKATAEGSIVEADFSAKPSAKHPIWYVAVDKTDDEGDFEGKMDKLEATEGNFTYTSLTGDLYFVDYYTAKTDKGTLITIEPESFEGNFYLEASTLFRDKSGKDLPAEFIIPNCKPQSAMTFAMASSGDPSTFTFTMDAFPGYTVYDKTKKVLAAIQILDERIDNDTAALIDGLTQF